MLSVWQSASESVWKPRGQKIDLHISLWTRLNERGCSCAVRESGDHIIGSLSVPSFLYALVSYIGFVRLFFCSLEYVLLYFGRYKRASFTKIKNNNNNPIGKPDSVAAVLDNDRGLPLLGRLVTITVNSECRVGPGLWGNKEFARPDRCTFISWLLLELAASKMLR